MNTNNSNKSQSQYRKIIRLQENIQAELITYPALYTSSASDENSIKPPLLFIHGSFHAAWCWERHFMPYFADLGYDCVAYSLRGTSGTYAGEGVTRVPIMDHVSDIDVLVQLMQKNDKPQELAFLRSNNKPILIGHSFGGLSIMKYLEEKGVDEVGGASLLCSVPPSGNGKMTLRFLMRSLVDSWKITAGFVLKKAATDRELCRELFFSDGSDNGLSNEDIDEIQERFKADTVATIDLRDLSKKLPSSNADKKGRAPFYQNTFPTLVVGAEHDFIVDRQGVEETAAYFGVDPVFVDSPHDIMIGRKWINCAEAVSTWLEKNSK